MIRVLSLEVDYEREAIKPFVKYIDNSLAALLSIIKCQYITCTQIEIEGRKIDCWSDDEALFNSHLVPTLYVNDELILFGNLVFANHDEEGASTGLSEDDIAAVMRYIREQNAKLFDWTANILSSE